MNEQIKFLVELQTLDTRIINHSRTIKNIPFRISSMEAPLKAAEEALDRANLSNENLEKKKRERETSVEENNDRLEKLKGRSGDIKDNKAYTAHLKEIDTIERTTRKIEDDLLESMERIEAGGTRVKDAEEALELEKQKAEALKKELDREVEEATAGVEENEES